MITYKNGGVHFFMKLLSLRGSGYLPALAAAIPCGVLAGMLKFICDRGMLTIMEGITDNAVWNGFSMWLGFLVIFRTSQSYARFWQGATCLDQMSAQWHDACSSWFAFSGRSDTENVR